MIAKLMNEVIGLTAVELERANKDHPMFHSNHEAWAVAREEFMETREALEDLEYEIRYLDYLTRHDDDMGIEDRIQKTYDKALLVACEAIQTAAMAEKWKESRGGERNVRET